LLLDFLNNYSINKSKNGKVTFKQKRDLKKLLYHLGIVGLSILSASLILSPLPVSALEPLETLSQTDGLEGAKSVLDEILKLSRAKPALSVAADIPCLACAPAAGVS
jgi:hypothetical protein